MVYKKRHVRDSETIDGIVDELLFLKGNYVDKNGKIDNNELDYNIDEKLENIYNDIEELVDNVTLMDLFEEYFGISKDTIRDIPELVYQDIKKAILRSLRK